MRPFWIKTGPKSSDGYSCGGGGVGRGKEQAHRRTGGKVISTQRDWNHKPRNTRNHQMVEARKDYL